MRSYGSAAPSEAAANEHGAHDPVSGSADASVADIDDDGIFDTGNRWSNVGWATMGFLSGAVFWHAVGFWAFLAGLLSHGPATETSVLGSDCVTLVIDRTTGTTSAEACPELIARLPDGTRNYRGPLLTAELRRARLPASRWEITVNSEGVAGASEERSSGQ
ncbi:MAG TPA: hypothetical protein PK264_02135 [Hyphomicrobiaceae bacterium]|nr:hypothetical protein [Hyphomicrobiaceae bacterium]